MYTTLALFGLAIRSHKSLTLQYGYAEGWIFLYPVMNHTYIDGLREALGCSSFLVHTHTDTHISTKQYSSSIFKVKG